MFLHISGEIFRQFFTEVHNGSSTQQSSSPRLCIKMNVTCPGVTLLPHSLSVTWQDPQLSDTPASLGVPTGGCVASVRMKLAQNTSEPVGSENLSPACALLRRLGFSEVQLGSGAEVWVVLSWAAITTGYAARSSTCVLIILDKYH